MDHVGSESLLMDKFYDTLQWTIAHLLRPQLFYSNTTKTSNVGWP